MKKAPLKRSFEAVEIRRPSGRKKGEMVMSSLLRLSRTDYRKAVRFIQEKARGIDQALFEYFFMQGPPSRVWEELERYQNRDGGFGHAIEPDFRLEPSSPMATTIGFQYLIAVNTPMDHPMVQKGIRYLLDTYDEASGRWQAIPESVNRVPHAPWWHYDEEQKRTSVEEAWGNPFAEIVGCFHRYPRLVPSDFLDFLTQRCMDYLDQTKLTMHECLCYVRLAEHAPEPTRDRIIEVVRSQLNELVDIRPESWDQYGMQPLTLIETPQSPFFKELAEDVDLNLDYLIEKQSDDGSWAPNWQWGQYHEDWKVAEEEWKGFLTVRNLMKLKAFGRIDFGE
jgi:hypothetical protein